MKTSKYSLLISNRKIPPSVYQLCRELTMTQSFCVTCHRMKSGLPCLRFFTAAAPAGPHLAMAGTIQALLNEQIELRFLVEQKCAVDAMQSLRRQQPCGVVEEYFSSRRKTSVTPARLTRRRLCTSVCSARSLRQTTLSLCLRSKH
jgi:hypothetical protein